MPRPTTEDFYQNFRFHLFDVTPTSGRLQVPLFALSPQIGFKSITPPSMTVLTEKIQAGNNPFPHTVVRGAETGNVTLRRGVFLGDAEFYQWTRQAIYGRGAFRRNLLLVQIHKMLGGTPPNFTDADDGSAARFVELGKVVTASLAASTLGQFGQGAVSAGLSAVGVDLPNVWCRIWSLFDVLPVGYRPGEDLDAADDSITVAELELDVEYYNEFNPGPLPISKGIV